ncbi:hypothetical protein AB0230_05100 [Microbacterium sp. NPDC089190]|uniref:hypothetical protein n=1 Tax=Microbacterium sp. NPDC089190 TaxID=3155063 RepID=UPI00344C70CA
MSLKILDDRIEANRAEAHRLKANHRDFTQTVASDPRLTLFAKQDDQNAGKKELQQKLDALWGREKQLVADGIRDLQRRVYGTAGTTPDAVISFRDAQERAGRLAKEEDALPVMTRALVNQDAGMADALLARAFDQNWANVIQAYAAEYPLKAQDVSDLNQLTVFQNNLAGQMEAALIYGAP